jgi:hypothetical protein
LEKLKAVLAMYLAVILLTTPWPFVPNAALCKLMLLQEDFNPLETCLERMRF